jgi:hypothetical protein
MEAMEESLARNNFVITRETKRMEEGNKRTRERIEQSDNRTEHSKKKSKRSENVEGRCGNKRQEKII